MLLKGNIFKTFIFNIFMIHIQAPYQPQAHLDSGVARTYVEFCYVV